MCDKELKHSERFEKLIPVLVRIKNHYFPAVISKYFSPGPQWKKIQHISVVYISKFYRMMYYLF